MEPVLYFRILSIALGALLALVGTVPLLGLSRHADIRGQSQHRDSPPRQPFLLWLAAVVGLAVVAATWWMHVKRPVAYSLAVTLVATLSVFWASQVLFNYARFRELQRKLAAIRPGSVAAFRAAVALVGVALVLLGVFVYRLPATEHAGAGRSDRVPFRTLTHASMELLIIGKTEAEVRALWGNPAQARRADFMPPRYGEPKTIPTAETQWIYRESGKLSHRLVYFRDGKVILAIEEWSDF